MPRQKLGQHFLRNEAVLKKIVDALAVADGDRVIEIGPGHGELTAPLARAARGKRCEIFCVEKDRTLIERLELLARQERSDSEHNEGKEGIRVNIIEGDALKLLSTLAITQTAPGKTPHYKIVGNIPYYITGKLLRTISELPQRPARTVLLIQKEVAERICAMPPAMNRLAASVQFWADVAIIAHVPRKDFSPPPEVDSAVVMLKNKILMAKPGAHTSAAGESVDPTLYYRTVRAIFSQPRKTLLNNLSATLGKNSAKLEISEQLQKIGIDPGARPQDLGIQDIIAVAQRFPWG
jgi:16S rRNA (adenine1518-N6/adenine1519-N6)-dimethyltransferase